MFNDPFIMAIIYGTDYADTGMNVVYHFSEWARLKRYGLPVEGVVIDNRVTGEETMIKDEDMMRLINSQRLHPVWMEEEVSA